MIARCLLLFGLCALAVPAWAGPIGMFADQADIGEVDQAGAASLSGDTYRVTGGGANIWGDADAFHYVWTQRSGDLHIAADIVFEGEGGDPHRKAGLMIRQNLTPGSPYADVMIHFPSGAMALWRANADGSDPVQLTHDPARRDWFAHLSPDGKWIAYVSFGDDVAVEDHPPNRQDVQLRLMPTDLSAPPVILTRLFGGQGTINVPSWSPDGKRIAFVSYRLKR